MAFTFYSRLPLNTFNSEIRTLTVHPSDDHEAPINCSLSIASLNDNCDFEALSYVWHEPSLADVAPVAILVNGCKFTPTPNLFSALQHLRLPQKPRKLWVDAICINQDDRDERNAQVPLMTRIYTSARAVAVWLGPSDDDVDTYVRLEPIVTAGIHLLKESFSRHFEDSSSPQDTETVTEMEKLWLSKACLLPALFLGRFLLVKNEYWTRIWTYQECCLPNASRVFYCGCNTLTREQVGASLIDNHVRLVKDLSEILTVQRRLSGGHPYMLQQRQNIKDYIAAGEHIHGTHRGSSNLPFLQHHESLPELNDALRHTVFHVCSDPQDRFYALYGLVSGRHPLPLVDYTKDAHAISAEIATYLILHETGAKLFDDWSCTPMDISFGPSSSTRPSWVPSFRETSLPFYNDFCRGTKRSPRNKVVSISQDFSTIKFQGKLLGTSQILTRFTSNRTSNIELFAYSLEQTLPTLKKKSEPTLFRESVRRLVTELLCPGRDSAQMKTLIMALTDGLVDRHSNGMTRLDEDRPSSITDFNDNFQLPVLTTALGAAIEGEVMFVTDDLHFGFGSAQVRDGDIVARLGDQRGSCVLRRCETTEPGKKTEDIFTMISPSVVRHLPLIWDAETEDSSTWLEDMTVDETEPVVFTIR